MARIRTIKPDFWRNEELSNISAEAALLAIGLLNFADDDGYFSANIKLIDADIFPLRELSSSTTVLLRELSEIGYISLYLGSDGKRYGQIINFTKHQVINKPVPSKIKDLCTLPDDYSSDTVELLSGKEGKGKEIETTSLVVSELTPCPHQEIISEFANALPELPQPRVWEGSRAKNLSARWKWVLADLKAKGKPCDKEAGIDFFRRMFGYIRESSFLMGKSNDWSCPGLHWIVESANFAKIIEGAYENKGAA